MYVFPPMKLSTFFFGTREFQVLVMDKFLGCTIVERCADEYARGVVYTVNLKRFRRIRRYLIVISLLENCENCAIRWKVFEYLLYRKLHLIRKLWFQRKFVCIYRVIVFGEKSLWEGGILKVSTFLCFEYNFISKYFLQRDRETHVLYV